ncbi:serine/threonine-protein kinase [Streptomyces sp. NPDC007325]|uniref:serine/threonine-protein kinase n=1 Tax=Streptomyces sp. NPDC007325 TaxID=3154588 RepID=UPI0033E68744
MEELRPDDPVSIGPYRLSARLGEGGMGQVFLGSSRSGRRLAVKVIRPEIAADPGFRERFRREVAAARTVGGFWTAPIVDADPEGPVPWVASDYLDAPDLEALVRDRGPLPEPELRSLAAGLAEALDAVHRAGLVHRDLKPSNILVTGTGPRLIDFGISKAVEGGTALTGTGLVVGTPGFMSPEQASGAPVGPPSDVFALGSVLAFAATGRPPFGEGSAPALLYRVVHDRPELDGVPPALRELVAACLEKAPARRPSPSLVLDLLGHGDRAGGAGPTTPPPPPATAVSQPARADAVADPGTVPAFSPVDPVTRVTAGVAEKPSLRSESGGCLAILGITGLLVSVGALAYSVTVAGVIAGAAVLAFVLGAVLLRGQPAVRSTVLLTADHLHGEIRDKHWSSPWTDVSRVTVRQARPADRHGRLWQLDALLREGAPVPKRFKGEGDRGAALQLHFDDSEDPRPALGRLDAGLRRHAGDRYAPDPGLTAYLDRPPPVTSPDAPAPG